MASAIWPPFTCTDAELDGGDGRSEGQEKEGEQGGAGDERVFGAIFAGRVRAAAGGAEAVERGHAQGGGEVAVGTAAGRGGGEGETERAADAAGAFEERGGGGRRLHRRAIDAATHRQLHPGIVRARALDARHDLAQVLIAPGAHVELELGRGGYDIRARAAAQHARVD